MQNYSAYGLLKQYNEHQMIKENYGSVYQTQNSMMYINLMFVLLTTLFFVNLYLLYINWNKLQPWAQILALLFFLTTDLRAMLISMFIISVGQKCGVSSF